MRGHAHRQPCRRRRARALETAGRAGTTIDSGPGQNARARRSSPSPNTATSEACSTLAGDQRHRRARLRPLTTKQLLHRIVAPGIHGQPVERVGRIRDDARRRAAPRPPPAMEPRITRDAPLSTLRARTLAPPTAPPWPATSYRARVSRSSAATPPPPARPAPTRSSTNTARRLVAPRIPLTIGLSARPVSEAVVSRPNPAPRAVPGITLLAAV